MYDVSNVEFIVVETSKLTKTSVFATINYQPNLLAEKINKWDDSIFSPGSSSKKTLFAPVPLI